MHLFVILLFHTILCILICCKAPRTILDLALYQIKYIIIIITRTRVLFGPYDFKVMWNSFHILGANTEKVKSTFRNKQLL